MKVVRALVDRVRGALRSDAVERHAMEITRAKREAIDAEARLDRCLRNALRHNPCAAAVLEIGQALRNGDATNPPAQPRPDPDDTE